MNVPTHDADMSSTGKRIRSQRIKLGLSPAELAERVSVSRPTIVNWEADKHGMKAHELIKLAIALNCNARWLLLLGEEEPTPYQKVSIEENRLLQAFRNLPEDRQDELIEDTERLARKFVMSAHYGSVFSSDKSPAVIAPPDKKKKPR